MKKNIFNIAYICLFYMTGAAAIPNGNFENGFIDWFSNFSDPANTSFLDTSMPFSGTQSACIDIQVTPTNWWDAQLINQNSGIQANTIYTVSFYAKSDGGDKQINVSLLDNVNYTSFFSETTLLNTVWTKYEYEFNSPAAAQNVGLFVSAGFEQGIFCFDEFKIEQECEYLVFEDNFDGTSLNPDFWTHEIGPGFNSSEPQYFTDNPANTQLSNGILNLIAREESINGYDYSSSAIITKDKKFWKYGRLEARMKVPGGQGIWPAFWLLPQQAYYGGWPNSGEVDIMEFQGSLLDVNFASVHYGISGPAHNSTTFEYNYPNGNLNDEYHVFGLEWVKDTLTWDLDGLSFHQITASQFTAPEYYPFNEPFYMLLNLSLGGWNGQPNNTTPFPSNFEIDYVRVYQELNDMTIYGDQYLKPFDQNIRYHVPEIAGASYQWSLSNGLQLLSGQGTSSITLNALGVDGIVQVDIITNCGSTSLSLDVNVDYNWCTNGDFENRLEHWYPSVSDANNYSYFDTTDSYAGNYSVCMQINNPSNPTWWEDQLVLFNTNIIEDASYEITFQAKCDSGNKTINVSLLDTESYSDFYYEDIVLNDQWTEHTFSFDSPTSFSGIGLFISCGFEGGAFCFDNFEIQSPGLSSSIYVDENSITVYPNPSADYVTIEGLLSNYNLKILDSNGVEVQALSTMSSTQTVRINNLGVGLYFLRIENLATQDVSLQTIIKS